MRILCIGDVHGRRRWKYVLDEVGEVDKVVFVGDYFDSYDINGIDQIKNFQDIMAYKEANPDKVVNLIGNHDFHYMPVAVGIGEEYGGYQPKFKYNISHLLQQHKSRLQMCYVHDQFIFTHAGITKTWLRSTLGIIEEATIDMNGKTLEMWVNDVFQYTPRKFLFNGFDPYGDDVTQSPIWVRPNSLNEDAVPGIHVIGHTNTPRPFHAPVACLDGKAHMIQIDAPDSNEYLVIEDGVPTVHQLKN